ncbi:MAG: M48 family metallopeptidase [Deltaproteobacteria bacterium]|nr:M48 family metallopeptidase [Deltaproteobacteria bacterium]MBI4223372.1 M48 family metallopeptidase [Deltaproteobacteria bacterium]
MSKPTTKKHKRLALKLLGLAFLLIPLALSFAPSDSIAKQPNKGESETVRSTTNKDGIQWDLQTGRQIYHNQIDIMKQKGIKVDNDPQMVGRLITIMNRLKKKSLIPDIPYEVHYIDTSVVNAVCYPGGGIMFFKGLFDPHYGLVDAKSNDEIAAVMGHEIAHATLRHGYKGYKKRQTLRMIGAIGSVATGAIGTDVGKIFDSVFDASTGIYLPAYSRKNEAAADLEGMITMMGAGYNPEKAIQVWDRAAKKSGNKGIKSVINFQSSIYSSHPSNNNRAKMLTKHLENLRRTTARK